MQYCSYLKSKRSLSDLIALFLIIDLVWGGSGRLIMFGNISFRTLLMTFAVIYSIMYMTRKKIIWSKQTSLLVCFLIYLIISFLIGVYYGNLSNALDEFFGYLPIVTIFFFSIYFKEKNSNWCRTIDLFKSLICLFAIFSILVWIYCYLKGESCYVRVESMFRKYEYGYVSFIGSIPRVFCKSSIFTLFGLLLYIDDYLRYKSIKVFLKIIILVLSILTTFTVSFYVFSVVIFSLYVVAKIKRDAKIKTMSTIIFIISIIACILVISGSYSILISRFSDNYKLSLKITQAEQLLDKWVEHPFFGTGLGQTVTVDYGDHILKKYQFEVQWLQQLVHMGLIGLSLFLIHIYYSIRKLYNIYILYRRNDLLILSFMILYICLVSFTNPFMNNSIGLLFYSMAAGIAEQYNVDL